MRSSAWERPGSAQIAFSTAVAALAQSKLAASTPHAAATRHARKTRQRMTRGSRVRDGYATDRNVKGLGEMPAVHPERAGTPHTLSTTEAKRALPQERPRCRVARRQRL